MTTIDYDRWTDIVDRETAGEELADEERAFAREFESQNELAGAEAALFAELSTDSVLEAGSADSLARNAVAIASSRRVSSRRRVLGGGFAFAAAAGAALWFSHAMKVQEPAALASTVEYLDGQVLVDGKPAGKGASVAIGQEVSAVSGVACIAVEPKIHVCVGQGSKIRVGHAFAPEKEVELLEGSLATALDPLPPGHHYSVIASGLKSTAVGTAFTVEKLASSVKTTVHEGKVRVGTDKIITAHKIGLSTAAGVEEQTLVEHAPTETPEWKALGTVAHRSIEGQMPAAPPHEETAVVQEPVAPVAEAHVAAPRHEAKAPEPKPETPAASASDLLAKARQALRGQSWQEAANAYRDLIGTYPSTAEARTALVPLAGLELDRLGQPAVALGHLDTYLASPGALSMEARLTRIRAFRALGRTNDEARAIDEFLEQHPESLEAERLRQRREALSQ